AKLLLLDLATLPGLFRVLSFIVVGAVMLAVAVRYRPGADPDHRDEAGPGHRDEAGPGYRSETEPSGSGSPTETRIARGPAPDISTSTSGWSTSRGSSDGRLHATSPESVSSRNAWRVARTQRTRRSAGSSRRSSSASPSRSRRSTKRRSPSGAS